MQFSIFPISVDPNLSVLIAQELFADTLLVDDLVNSLAILVVTDRRSL